MLRGVADTHAIIWYLFDDPRLSETARTLIEESGSTGDKIGISAITLAEMLYLSEKGRIRPQALERVLAVVDKPRAILSELPVNRAVVAAMATIDRGAVPDLPDRIIAATAQLHNVPLISRDGRIRLSKVQTVW